jgi:two-component system CheB/CheR fusion protein
MMDKTHVTQILVNLLSNAMKFTPENGKVEFFTKIERIGPHQVRHVYTISDTGCGMSAAFQKKMYLPFEQENSNHIIGGGTGLGLYIVKSLVSLLGGTIDCSSKLNNGTTFTVTLTYTEATPEQQKAAVPKPEIDDTSLKGLKILLCDDHEINRDITKLILENKGATVICAANGQEAVQYYSESSEGEYSLILMDIRMPIMDGLQATMKIRSYNRNDATLPIIALTANALEAEEHICIDAGMNARLTKPIDPQTLYKTIQTFTK